VAAAVVTRRPAADLAAGLLLEPLWVDFASKTTVQLL